MEELGFDPNGPEGAQKAFIKSLLKQAGEQTPRTNKHQESAKLIQMQDKLKTKSSLEEQLAFDLEAVDHISKNKIV